MKIPERVEQLLIGLMLIETQTREWWVSQTLCALTAFVRKLIIQI
jgi:hypothetical protein